MAGINLRVLSRAFSKRSELSGALRTDRFAPRGKLAYGLRCDCLLQIELFRRFQVNRIRRHEPDRNRDRMIEMVMVENAHSAVRDPQDLYLPIEHGPVERHTPRHGLPVSRP